VAASESDTWAASRKGRESKSESGDIWTKTDRFLSRQLCRSAGWWQERSKFSRPGQEDTWLPRKRSLLKRKQEQGSKKDWILLAAIWREDTCKGEPYRNGEDVAGYSATSVHDRHVPWGIKGTTF
jgi:hypothetical protein